MSVRGHLKSPLITGRDVLFALLLSTSTSRLSLYESVSLVMSAESAKLGFQLQNPEFWPSPPPLLWFSLNVSNFELKRKFLLNPLDHPAGLVSLRYLCVRSSIRPMMTFRIGCLLWTLAGTGATHLTCNVTQ